MSDSDRKDLAQILIEGTKVVYGSEKSEQVLAEFEKLERQPIYRRNARDLTEVVERICYSPEVLEAEVVGSIDTVAESKPSRLKVVVKGTVNLINKTCWYYPLVGALPAKYQEKIAEKLGDKASYYTITNGINDALVGLGVGTYLQLHPVTAAEIITFLGAIAYAASGVIRALESKDERSGSLLLTIPFKVVEALKSHYALEKQIKEVQEVYPEALNKSKLNPQLGQRLGENTQPVRIEYEIPEIEGEDVQDNDHISQQRRR